MMILAIIVGCVLGILIGFISPTIPYTVSQYLAIGIVAALDSVFGGIASNIKKNFDIKVFISGFFVNAILAMILTYLGEQFVGRMFNNLGIIRRYYLDVISEKKLFKKKD